MVERFSNSQNSNGLGFSNGVVADDDGYYVRHSDYRTLEGEVERLRAENEAQFVVVSTEITDQDGFNIEQRVAWKDILLSRAEAAEARVAELEVGKADLREALLRLEHSCEQLAATRTHGIYTTMIDGGQAQELLELDNARRAARTALTKGGSNEM